jgi:hypothetical protein
VETICRGAGKFVIAWLSSRTTGSPPAVTRIAAVVQFAIVQGGGGGLPGGAHPVTEYAGAIVETAMPPTITLGFGVVGVA